MLSDSANDVGQWRHAALVCWLDILLFRGIEHEIREAGYEPGSSEDRRLLTVFEELRASRLELLGSLAHAVTHALQACAEKMCLHSST